MRIHGKQGAILPFGASVIGQRMQRMWCCVCLPTRQLTLARACSGAGARGTSQQALETDRAPRSAQDPAASTPGWQVMLSVLLLRFTASCLRYHCRDLTVPALRQFLHLQPCEPLAARWAVWERAWAMHCATRGDTCSVLSSCLVTRPVPASLYNGHFRHLLLAMVILPPIHAFSLV